MSERERIFTVKEGEEYALKHPSGMENKIRILPKCDTNRGFWICVTHNESFCNQMQKDSHISGRGKHVLAWNCSEHGPEVP